MGRTIQVTELRESAVMPATGLAVGLAVVAAVLGWRGADAPNYLFRIELFRRAGLVVWNTAWYGGHSTLGYSVLLPPLGALLGPAVLGVVVAGVAAACFARLLDLADTRRPARRRAAALVFAAGTVTNIAVGRLAFAIGLAAALAALLAGVRRRWWVAVALSAVTSLGSPVAGCFLVVAWAAVAMTPRGRDRRWAVAAAAMAAAPLATATVLVPQVGTFPFRAPALLVVLAASAAVVVLLPRRLQTLRLGALLYAAAAMAAFAVPNPLGGNVARLGMYVAAPILVAFARPVRAVVLVVSLPFLVFWQWSPAFDGITRAGADPSSRPAYDQPLIDFFREQQLVGRVEIPSTRRHFEAAYVATVVPLARGWERQVDIARNPLFYEPRLDATAYGRWLRDDGVQFVALPDVALDPSAVAEAALLGRGLPYLEPVWQGTHWRVWRVVGSPGLVSGPATLVGESPRGLTLDLTGPGTVIVRVHWTRTWSVAGPACVEPGPQGWTRLRSRGHGRLVVRTALLGTRGHCLR